MSVEHPINIDQRTKIIRNELESLKKKFDKQYEECKKYYQALEKSAEYIDSCNKSQISLKP